MKSIPLDNVKLFCRTLTPALYAELKENEDEIRAMWSEQGLGFWVKFAVGLRKFIMQSSSKYDERCEKELILFLKALTFKNFRELESYFRIAGKSMGERDELYSQVSVSDEPNDKFVRSVTSSDVDKYSELRAVTLKLKCAGSLVLMYRYWKDAKSGSDLKFTPPESWFIPVQVCEPFESFIRAKWSGYRNLEEILGCKKEDLGWWQAPARKVDQSKLETKSKISKPDQSSTPRALLTKKSSKLEKVKEKKANWLPRLDHVPISKINLPAAKAHSSLFAGLTLPELRPLLTYSILPFLKKKYHTIDARALAKDTKSRNYLGVSPWYVMCLELFGNSYMHYVHTSNEDAKKFMNGGAPDQIDKWVMDRKNDNTVLENLRDKISAPDEASDCVDNSAEFLLEPCILIQLPWQPTLFRQWLSAALIEVLKFELESMEFRHWPVFAPLEPIIRDLLSMVAALKERILLGWTVMSYDVSEYPKVDRKYPDFILNEVLLPSLPTLEFLLTEQPYKILRSLKKLMWSKPKQNISADGHCILSRTAFTINGNLTGFYSIFYGHAMYFNPYNKCTEPFATVHHANNVGLYQQLHDIKNMKKILPGEEGFDLHVQSIEESRLRMLTQQASLREPSRYGSKNIEKVQCVIRQVIVKCKHFSPESCTKLIQLAEMKSYAPVAIMITGSMNRELSELELLFLSCIMYYDLNELVEQNKGDRTVLGCMNRLSAMALEREQLVRIIACCAYIVDECPTYCGTERGKCQLNCIVDNTKPMDLDDMKSILSSEQQKMKDSSNIDIWSKLNEEWRKPVEYNPAVPKLEDGISNVITALENRIGRVAWNATQKAFHKISKGGDPYPDAVVVQYILPCHVACLVDAAKSPKSERNTARLNNLITYLHNVVHVYEKSFYEWLEGPGKCIKHIVKQEYDPELRKRCVMSNYFIERCSFALHGYVGLGRMGEELDAMPHFAEMSQAMLEFPMFHSTQFTSEIELINSTVWVNFIYTHIAVLHDVIFKYLPVPNADSILYCHELQDFYFASALIQMLDSCYCLTSWYALPYMGRETPEHVLYNNLLKPLRSLRYEIFAIVFETEGKFDYPKSMLEKFVNGSGKEIFQNMFNVFQSAQKFVNPSQTSDIHFPNWGESLSMAFEQFKAGKLKTLTLFEKKVVVESSKVKQGVLAECNNCHRKETNPLTFIQCRACKESKFPYPNFYCSERCEQKWWRVEHMAEHLEFDLGLCDFANLKM